MSARVREYWGERPCIEPDAMEVLSRRLRPRWEWGARTRLRPVVLPLGWCWWLAGGGIARSWLKEK